MSCPNILLLSSKFPACLNPCMPVELCPPYAFLCRHESYQRQRKRLLEHQQDLKACFLCDHLCPSMEGLHADCKLYQRDKKLGLTPPVSVKRRLKLNAQYWHRPWTPHLQWCPFPPTWLIYKGLALEGVSITCTDFRGSKIIQCSWVNLRVMHCKLYSHDLVYKVRHGCGCFNEEGVSGPGPTVHYITPPNEIIQFTMEIYF